MKTTVRIRVAVAVGADGACGVAMVYDETTRKQADENAAAAAIDMLGCQEPGDGDDILHVRFIEADVPVPQPDRRPVLAVVVPGAE